MNAQIGPVIASGRCQRAACAASARHLAVRAFQAQADTPLYESQAAVQQTSARAFANFTIYKGKAALALRVTQQLTCPGSMACACHSHAHISCTLGSVNQPLKTWDVQVIKPSWQRTADGDFKLAKAGNVLLELAPVVGGTGTQPGERRSAPCCSALVCF